MQPIDYSLICRLRAQCTISKSNVKFTGGVTSCAQRSKNMASWFASSTQCVFGYLQKTTDNKTIIVYYWSSALISWFQSGHCSFISTPIVCLFIQFWATVVANIHLWNHYHHHHHHHYWYCYLKSVPNCIKGKIQPHYSYIQLKAIEMKLQLCRRLRF